MGPFGHLLRPKCAQCYFSDFDNFNILMSDKAEIKIDGVTPSMAQKAVEIHNKVMISNLSKGKNGS